MGVLIDKNNDSQLYADTYEEVLRIIRISEEEGLSADTEKPITNHEQSTTEIKTKPRNYDKITTAKLAEKFGIDNYEFTKMLADNGYIELKGKNTFLTDKGREVGGEVKKGQYGYFIVWSVDLDISFEDEKQSFADKLRSLFRM